MGVLPDWMIERDIKIEPLATLEHRPDAISYGVTSYGYDVRVDRHFKVFTNVWGSTVDPKHFDPKSFVDVEGDYCIIPPNSFALAETVEYLEIPRDILCVCLGKSTYARCGIIVNVTPLEPEWRGRGAAHQPSVLNVHSRDSRGFVTSPRSMPALLAMLVGLTVDTGAEHQLEGR